MSEVWKAIPGFEGAFGASTLGRLRSLDRIVSHNKGGTRKWKGRIMRNASGTGGYLTAGLSAWGKRRHTLVHVLIAETFVPNPQNLPEVDHKDKNRTNNTPENLAWVTRVGNVPRGEDSGHAKLTDGQVYEIRGMLSAGMKQKTIAEIYGLDPSAISNINRRRNWFHL